MTEFRILCVLACLIVFSACQPKLLYTLVPETEGHFWVNDIRYNNLDEYNSLAYYLPSEVWSLRLNNFPLEPFPEEFKSFKKIRYLTLEGYQAWYDFPEEIYSWSSIEAFEAEAMNLKKLPDGLMRFPLLKELHIGNNAFTSFPENICGAKIEYLWFGNNPLIETPDIPSCFSKAKIIDVSKSNSTEWSPELKVQWQEQLPNCQFIWE